METQDSLIRLPSYLCCPLARWRCRNSSARSPLPGRISRWPREYLLLGTPDQNHAASGPTVVIVFTVYLLGEDELMEVILQVVGHARAAVPVVHGEEGELRVSLSSKWSYVILDVRIPIICHIFFPYVYLEHLIAHFKVSSLKRNPKFN